MLRVDVCGEGLEHSSGFSDGSAMSKLSAGGTPPQPDIPRSLLPSGLLLFEAATIRRRHKQGCQIVFTNRQKAGQCLSFSGMSGDGV
jgi:hypothetical protein